MTSHLIPLVVPVNARQIFLLVEFISSRKEYFNVITLYSQTSSIYVQYLAPNLLFELRKRISCQIISRQLNGFTCDAQPAKGNERMQGAPTLQQRGHIDPEGPEYSPYVLFDSTYQPVVRRRPSQAFLAAHTRIPQLLQ